LQRMGVDAIKVTYDAAVLQRLHLNGPLTAGPAGKHSF